MKKIKPDGSRTLYIGGIYEVDKNSGGTVTGTKTYYPAAGAIVGEDRFYPFGETRLTTGSIFTDKLFTGQREMTGLGIYHYNARFYSPKLGRFLSPDTIVPNPANPQDLNRYSYVVNNPLKYIDPTGRDYCPVLPWLCGSGSTGSGGASSSTSSGGGSSGSGGSGGGGNPSPDPLPVPDPAPAPTTTPTPTVTLPTPTVSSTPPSSFTPASSEHTCEDCGAELLEGILHFAEGTVFAAVSLVALGAVLSVGPAGLIAAPVFVVTALVGINFAIFGVQEIMHATGSEIEPDPIPLIHLVFPEYGR